MKPVTYDAIFGILLVHLTFNPRTIISVESSYRTLNLRFFVSHPNIARFIEILKNKEYQNRV